MATLGKSTITELSLLNPLDIANGGTGANTFTSGAAIIGNGTSAFTTRSITNNTTATAVTASTNLITANTLYYHKGNSNIVTVGTITSGTWNGTAIANAYLANSKVTVAGKDISLGSSLSAADLKTALGLNNVSNTAASGYLTALSSNTTNAVSITVGGTTKNITVATMKSSLGLGALAYKASLGKADVGLGNVDNTADANKSVNYATTAGSATKATQDGDGNDIASTYALASALDSYLLSNGGSLTGPMYFSGATTNRTTKPILAYSSSSPNRGIHYYVGTEYDRITLCATGYANQWSVADVCIKGGSDGCVYIRGEKVAVVSDIPSLDNIVTTDGMKLITGKLTMDGGTGFKMNRTLVESSKDVWMYPSTHNNSGIWYHEDTTTNTAKLVFSASNNANLSNGADLCIHGGTTATVTIRNKRVLTEDDLSNVGGGGGTTITDYVSTTKTTTQSIMGGLILGATSISSPSMSAGRLMLTGSTNPLIGVQATGGTLFYFQSQGDTMFLGPTSSKALAFTGSTGAIRMPNTLTVTGNVTAPTFVGALSGNATSATSAETVSSYTSASSDGSARPVWFAWNDGSKKPTYHTNFTYTVNTGTLAAANFSGHLVGNGVYYGVCDTAQATKAKTVTIDGFPSTLTAGLRVTIKFTNAAAASTMTLKINDLEAKNICRYGTTAASSGTTTTGWRAGSVQTFTYDGTSWVREYWENTTYSNVALGHGYATTSSADGATAITATLSSYALTTGGTVAVKFTYAVPSSATLNINSKGAKAIYYKGVSITAGIIYAGDTATFIYDGTAYHLISIDRGMEGGAMLASSSSAIELVPNNLYVASSASSLTVTFKTPTNANAINNYMLQVTAGSSGCSITFPTRVKWANGIAPTLDANATYQFSILNNCGVWTKFA